MSRKQAAYWNEEYNLEISICVFPSQQENSALVMDNWNGFGQPGLYADDGFMFVHLSEK